MGAKVAREPGKFRTMSNQRDWRSSWWWVALCFAMVAAAIVWQVAR